MFTPPLITITGGGTIDRSPYAYEERVLYVSVSAVDADMLHGATYEWKIGDRIVSTGSGLSYTPDDADIGQQVTVTAIVPDPSGSGSIRYASSNAKTIIGLNDPATGTLDFSIVSAERKYVAIDGILDEDGRGPMSYQWFVDGKALAGANGSEFILPPGPVQSVALQGTYTDALGRVTTVVSGQPLARTDMPGTLVFSGAVAPNGVVRANAADPDGIVVSHFAWDVLDAQGNWSAVRGATGPELAFGATVPVAVRSHVDYADAGGAVFRRTTLLGTEGADELRGTANVDDLVHAGGGNDIIRNASRVDGGAGLDTWVSGWSVRVLYQLADQPGAWRADSTLADSMAILTNVERVMSGQSGIALDIDGNGGQAFRLYEAAFDRRADPVGLGFWMARLDEGMSLKAVAQAFVASTEFSSMYGATPTNADIVAKFYANILGRAPDPTGAAFWNHALDTGAASVADVLVEFSESAENVAALVGAVQNGIHYTPYTGL